MSRLTLCLVLLAGSGWAQTISLDTSKSGAVPEGWTVAMTHEGGAPKWEVLRDDSAPSKPNVLAQTSTDRTSGRFPLAVFEEASFQNGSVTVKFKPVSGAGDQAAGIVWRYEDPGHYYIVRANALEDNVVLYKVEKGKRKSLDIVGRKGGYGVEEKVAPQTWHTLRVEFAGTKFTVLFNGRKLFEVEDETFKDGGKVGLWTKADSVMLFDDFNYGGK